jgi:hypothetical protein
MWSCDGPVNRCFDDHKENGMYSLIDEVRKFSFSIWPLITTDNKLLLFRICCKLFFTFNRQIKCTTLGWDVNEDRYLVIREYHAPSRESEDRYLVIREYHAPSR